MLKRTNYVDLMEIFTALLGDTKQQLDTFNQVCRFLRVITLADLTHDSGDYIPEGMLTGKWQARSDLVWPHQPCPLKVF